MKSWKVEHGTRRRGIPLWVVLAAAAALTLGGSLLLRGNRSDAAGGSFHLTTCIIPKSEIRDGGPPKDGIPALTTPAVLGVADAGFLASGDTVIGVVAGGEARAYPLKILTWHENVNDVLGGVPIAVTYCPLCHSAIVFNRRVGGEVREFGISGLLWNSNVLLYDRQPRASQESLWSQLAMKAVCGPAARRGLTLEPVPSERLSWADWRSRHPGSTVLSTGTEYPRDYARNPYSSYFSSDEVMFPVTSAPDGDRFRNKEHLVVLTVGPRSKAYAVSDLSRVTGPEGTFEDSFAGSIFRFSLHPSSGDVRVERIGGSDQDYGVAYSFWFAWRAVHPRAEVFSPSAPG
jgi:hypothetical protein